MQKLVLAFFIFLSGCGTFPRDSIVRPMGKDLAKKYCVSVKFEQLREGPVTREVEPFPLAKQSEAMYRESLRNFGIETECENPVDSFEFTYVLRGGMKIPSFKLLAYSLSIVTLGIIPYKTDMIIDLKYTRHKPAPKGEPVSYLIPVDQWISIFLIPKEISQNKEARDVFGLYNYWDVVVVGNVAKIILSSLSTVSKIDSEESQVRGIETARHSNPWE